MDESKKTHCNFFLLWQINKRREKKLAIQHKQNKKNQHNHWYCYLNKVNQQKTCLSKPNTQKEYYIMHTAVLNFWKVQHITLCFRNSWTVLNSQEWCTAKIIRIKSNINTLLNHIILKHTNIWTKRARLLKKSNVPKIYLKTNFH